MTENTDKSDISLKREEWDRKIKEIPEGYNPTDVRAKNYVRLHKWNSTWVNLMGKKINSTGLPPNS